MGNKLLKGGKFKSSWDYLANLYANKSEYKWNRQLAGKTQFNKVTY